MMKDKLVKYNHKALYYRVRKACIFFGIICAAGISAAIPLSISLAINTLSEAETEEINDNIETVVTEDNGIKLTNI